MLILTLRTDKPEAEIGLYDNQEQLAYETWQAHRELAETISKKIIDVLQAADKRLHELNGIVVYKGPGSFTGLRIGLTVANALAYSLTIPIVSQLDDDWLSAGIERLQANYDEKITTPEYGALPHITAPKH
jgi:tRNA threonylcarbamoyladenosine biosynthesis protein TsaB